MMVHIDTVHPIGTLEHFPWAVEDDKIYGPGIMDMKASAAIALTAIKALRERSRLPDRRITLMFNSDEETGSHTSLELIQSQAKVHDLVLCLEPGFARWIAEDLAQRYRRFRYRGGGEDGACRSESSDGVNAIHELSHQIQAITGLADEEAGTTLNVDLVQGGTRTNVIAAHAQATVDIRVLTEEERARVDSGLDGLKPRHPKRGCQLPGSGTAHQCHAPRP